MFRQTFIVSAFLLLSVSIGAQPSSVRKNTIGLNWGMGKIMRQDFIFSPILHKQWSPQNLAVTFSHSDNLEHLLYVKYGRYTPSVTEPYTFYWDTPDELSPSGKHKFNMLDLSYSLGRQVLGGNSLRVIIGGRSRNRLHQSYYCYGPDWLWEFGYLFSFGFDAWTAVSYDNRSNRLVMNLAFPIFSYVARSPYMAQNDEYFENIYSHKALHSLVRHIADGELQSPGKSKSLDLDLTYSYKLSDRCDIGAGYWLSLNFNNIPVDFRSVENVFYLNTTFRF